MIKYAATQHLLQSPSWFMFWKTGVNEQFLFFMHRMVLFVVYYPKKLCWVRTWSTNWQKLSSNLDKHMHLWIQFFRSGILHCVLILLYIRSVWYHSLMTWFYATSFISIYLDCFLFCFVLFLWLWQGWTRPKLTTDWPVQWEHSSGVSIQHFKPDPHQVPQWLQRQRLLCPELPWLVFQRRTSTDFPLYPLHFPSWLICMPRLIYVLRFIDFCYYH